MGTVKTNNRDAGWTLLILMLFNAGFSGVIGFVGVENIPFPNLFIGLLVIVGGVLTPLYAYRQWRESE